LIKTSSNPHGWRTKI